MRARAGSHLRIFSPLEQRIRNMFGTGGYDGFILDASDISTLNQVSTGTTPVTAVTQPMGWFGDKHLGMGLGPELMTNGNSGTFDTNITGVSAVGAASISRDATIFPSGALKVVSGGTNTGAKLLTFAAVVGKTYKIQASLYAPSSNVVSNGAVLSCNSAGGTTSEGVQVSSEDTAQVLSFLFTATATSHDLYAWVLDRGVAWGSAGDIAYFDNISVKLLDGNHAIQATAAARPTWQVDANGHHLARTAGVDDSLSCATGGGGSTGFLLCAALKPTGGAGTVRTLYDDTGTNTGYKVQIDAANKLSFSAGNGTAFTTLASTATADVGTTNYFTVKDDGTNLSVQIGSAAAETVARPVVVAGTAGYTLFKKNGAASELAIVDAYRIDGIKNWAGTAAQLAAIQSWVKAGAGL